MRSRRPVAIVAATAVVAAAAWAGIARPWQDETPQRIGPTAPIVAALEATRRSPDAQVREVSLTAAPAKVDLGDRVVETWAFNGTVPGPEIRVRAGDVVRARVRNDLPQPFSVHWHGIALRNNMDGVPDVTQKEIPPGGEFTYEFTAPDPGTYFYHSHSGTQLDRGVYAPLIVEDRAQAAEPDATLLLDDWIDGTGTDPDKVFAKLRSSGMEGMGGSAGSGGMAGMGGMGGKATPPTPEEMAKSPLGKDTGDVDYPLYLINGRAPTTPAEITVQPGVPIRLRLVNAGADTPFRVAVAGSQLRVVATDGFAVEPVTVDTLLIGMGERYDVLVTVPGAGAVPIVAVAEGKSGGALAVLRSGPGAIPAPDVRPAELDGDLLSIGDLRSAASIPSRPPDRTAQVTLTSDMAKYDWGLEVPTENGVTLPVRKGERVRLVLKNETMMWHPIHLHGHTFQLVGGPRKDTVVVPPMSTVTVEFDADNPGQWLLHCHNAYHAEAGMKTVLSYVGDGSAGSADS